MAKVVLPSGKIIVAAKESLERAFQLIEAWGKVGKKQPMPANQEDELHGAVNQAEPNFAQHM